MKILIVEDDDDSRLYLESILRAKDYDVLCASNGIEALEIVIENTPHLIISDILMPEMDGYELCRYIKSHVSLKHIPFIFYTATYTNPTDEQFAIELGASRFIIKPMETEQFMSVINEVIHEMKTGHPSIPEQTLLDESSFNAIHAKILTNKLEKKVRQLESEREKLKRAERSLLRMNKALTTLFESERVLTHSTNKEELLSGICRLLVDLGGYRLAWVGIAENDPEKTVRPIAWAGIEDGYLEKIKISWADNKYSQGPTGHAIRFGMTCVVHDVHKNPDYQPWRNEALKRGYESSVALPLKNSDGVFGALNIYAKEPDVFNGEEIELLEKLAEELAYGLNALRDKDVREIVQDKLTNAMQDLSNIMMSIPDVLYKIDTDSKLVLWNRRFEQVTGYDANDLLGKNATDFFTIDDIPRVESAIKQAYEEGHSEIEVDLITKNGESIPYQFSGSPIVDEHGIILGLTGVGRDLSDHRKAENEKEKLQRQLQQAQKMEALGHLTGGIAHDFNNILAVIMGYTSLAKTGIKSDISRDILNYLTEVGYACERAKELVDQLLTFSRSGGYGAEPGILVLDAQIKEVIKMLRPVLPSSIDIRLHIEQEYTTILADHTPLQQVLMNLLVNARDAMEGKGRIDILLRMSNIHDLFCSSCLATINGNFIELAIQDNGCGIGEDKMEHLFEPFFTTKAEGKGTGMGLAVAHGIMHDIDGHIIVESELNTGTTFRLLFPPAKHEMNAAAHNLEQNKRGEILDGMNRHVMIVDDEASIAGYLKALLETFGFQVKTFTSSNEALFYFQENHNKLDLVITDQTMPKMTGTELAQSLLAERPDLPIILCTGFSEEVNEESAKSMGIAEFLMKPIETDELLTAIITNIK